MSPRIGSAAWREAHPDAPTAAEAEEDLAMSRYEDACPGPSCEWSVEPCCNGCASGLGPCYGPGYRPVCLAHDSAR